ncbi:DUF1080 domain-containing protein [Maribacter algarum]|uniref:DUF1080 domain-containing protein n=2 Tax=Maribacter algarum (ex Zhang et al. 2020) TaxID=2578118 RepID=A0A5S3PS34_9FLAO|nr:DUF1080 domain-containing protein [Maribacter algarum]
MTGTFKDCTSYPKIDNNEISYFLDEAEKKAEDYYQQILVKTLKTYFDKKSDNTGYTSDVFKQIFDGKSLEGWHGDTNYWRVENGTLVGEVTPTTPLKSNTFLIWQGGEPADFELKLEFRISEAGNSGINYRSETLDSIPYALRGYQADIDGKIRYTGQNYEERKRTTLAYRGEKVIISSQGDPDEVGSLRANVKNNCWQSREVVSQLGESDSLKTKIKFEDWNELYLIVEGNRMRHFVNGILMSDVQDDDSVNRKMSGKLGMQVHVGPPMKVEYRNIRLKNL